MVLGGLALALSRLIDNSVVVLENIYRHLEMGESPIAAAAKGGKEVALPVLASTLTTAIVFFPSYSSRGCQQVSLLGDGDGCCSFARCLLRCCNDGRAALLLQIFETKSSPRLCRIARGRSAHARGEGRQALPHALMPNSIRDSKRCWAAMNYSSIVYCDIRPRF